LVSLYSTTKYIYCFVVVHVFGIFKLKQGIVFNLVKVQRRKDKAKARKLYKRISIFDNFMIVLLIAVAVVLPVSLRSSLTEL